MSQPPGPGPGQFLDTGNRLLGPAPVYLETGTVVQQGGSLAGTVTMRSATTTMTAFLSADELSAWAKVISDLAATVRGGSPGLVLPTAGETIALGNSSRRPPAS
jgi:hypothetical protein